MRKFLRILAVSTGIVSVLATVILAFIYLEDVLGHINFAKTKIIDKINERRSANEDVDITIE